MGLSAKKPEWVAISDNVSGLSSTSLDQNLISEINGVKYVIAATGNGLTKTLEMLIANASDGLHDSIFAILGDQISFQINIVSESGFQKLQIVNNESFLINFEIKKLLL